MIYKNMITVRVGTQRAAIIRDKIHEQIICEIRFIVSFLSGGSRIYKKIEVIKVQNKAKINHDNNDNNKPQNVREVKHEM